ncbi:MAG TPA: DJ-1/PfpI family protein [Kribbella sp.]|uniref:GlxA family transcriptional regulator n=1 Tax=Kribbella sp. TaxID=1871183 RepID=UPI002D771E47|nr:DJ-1/PfpI family protein [Kribbella sp.]HET6295041.1 DJ-1/PfpI family protein [Kribbella sp.]
MAADRSVLVVVYDGVRLLDVTGPLEVFAVANEQGGRYRSRLASPDGRDVVANTGTRLGVDLSLAEADARDATLVVPGGPNWPETINDAELMDQIRRLSGQSARTASVCAGAFALAAAGLLDGRRATTHWELADQLARRFPAVQVDRDAIFIQDGPMITSAGVTSGIDLALALVEADLGAETARMVAKQLVVFLQRPGGQSQFSVRASAGQSNHDLIRKLLDAITVDPAGDHSLSSMAARVGVSARHLTRLFNEEVGATPARFVEKVRVEAAQHLLETGAAPLDRVARQTGLGSPETLRRAFTRVIGTTPGSYRSRFHTTGVTNGSSAGPLPAGPASPA